MENYNRNNNLIMWNLNNPAHLEAVGLGNVWTAYAKHCSREDIMEVGFNKYSGYVYIALENAISICSAFGKEVEYLVTDPYDGTEYFEETYDEAIIRSESLNDE